MQNQKNPNNSKKLPTTNYQLPAGLIQVYTGNGKGKTTAAFGLALRASGQDLRTLIIQFLKPKDYESGEVVETNRSLPNITVKRCGDSKIWGKIKPKKIYQDDAKNFCTQAWDYLKEHEKEYDLVILDELGAALNNNLVDLDKVIQFLKRKPQGSEIVLTGRNMPKEIIELADLVSEIKEIKHPFSAGIKARRGIEF